MEAAELSLFDPFHIIVQRRERGDIRDDETEHQRDQYEHDDGGDAVLAFSS